MSNEAFEIIHKRIMDSWILFSKTFHPKNENYDEDYEAWHWMICFLLMQEGYTFSMYQQTCMQKLRESRD